MEVPRYRRYRRHRRGRGCHCGCAACVSKSLAAPRTTRAPAAETWLARHRRCCRCCSRLTPTAPVRLPAAHWLPWSPDPRGSRLSVGRPRCRCLAHKRACLRFQGWRVEKQQQQQPQQSQEQWYQQQTHCLGLVGPRSARRSRRPSRREAHGVGPDRERQQQPPLLGAPRISRRCSHQQYRHRRRRRHRHRCCHRVAVVGVHRRVRSRQRLSLDQTHGHGPDCEP